MESIRLSHQNAYKGLHPKSDIYSVSIRQKAGNFIKKGEGINTIPLRFVNYYMKYIYWEGFYTPNNNQENALKINGTINNKLDK